MSSRTHPLQSNFTAGEWSPRLYARADLGKYFNACRTLENFVLHPQGGASGRCGTHFVAEVKSSADGAKLFPFRFSSTQAYILELGNFYARVYTDNGRVEVTGTPVEIATPWTIAEVWELHIAQSADTLFLVHPDHFPRQLVRYSHTVWRLGLIPFEPVPSYEYGTRSTTYLIPGAVSGTNVQFDAGADSFLASDLGREIVSGTGRATITVVDSASRVHADITSSFESTAQIASGAWSMPGSPETACHLSSTIYTAQTPPVGASVSLTLAADGWRAADVGKHVRIYGGALEITAYSSATVVTATVRTALDGMPDATGAMGEIVAGAWSLEEPAWSSALGYPKSVDWSQGRLVFGGTATQPKTWWASSVANPFDFLIGSNDADAMEWTVDSSEVNAIEWLAQADALLIGTAGATFAVTGGNESAITPSNTPLVSRFSAAKCSPIRPVRAGDTLLFLTASQKQLLEASYKLEKNGYTAPNLLLLANHLTESHLTDWITDLAYQAEPDGVVWAVRSDGVLLGMTYLRDQDVVGWHRHTTQGDFESVAVIPEPDLRYDQVWVVVRRTIGGVTKRYVEYFDASWDVYDGETPGVHTDACLTLDSPVAVSTVSGLSHLEGQAVKVVGNGSAYPDAVVSGGAITLAGPPASQIEVGLGYTPTLQTMEPEDPGAGSSQALTKSWAQLTVRFQNTLGAVVNGETLPWRAAGDPLGVPPPLFTGDKPVAHRSYSTTNLVTVTQPNPLPITVLGITGILVVGDG